MAPEGKFSISWSHRESGDLSVRVIGCCNGQGPALFPDRRCCAALRAVPPTTGPPYCTPGVPADLPTRPRENCPEESPGRAPRDAVQAPLLQPSLEAMKPRADCAVTLPPPLLPSSLSFVSALAGEGIGAPILGDQYQALMGTVEE